MSNTITKPEKLASAVYLITSFFADQEPLKWRLRTLASEFVSAGISVSDNLSMGEQSKLRVRALALEVASLLSLAKNAGLVSDANHSIIHQEFFKYLGDIGAPNGISEIFRLETSKESSSTTPNVPKEVPKEQIIKDKSTFELPAVRQLLDESVLANSSASRESDGSHPRPLREFGAVSVKKNTRQSAIIGLLKRKKEIMIKDVLPLIQGVSEKTIQRELLAMVEDGVLKKIGEKRWSRYSLA